MAKVVYNEKAKITILSANYLEKKGKRKIIEMVKKYVDERKEELDDKNTIT